MPLKVLLVDDEVGFTELLKMNLERSGEYKVRIQNDAREALQAAVDFQPDVILLDVVMPGLDGGEVAARLSEDSRLRSVPVVMMTALVTVDEADPEAVVRSGSKFVLPKPINTDLLKRFIRDAVESADPVGV